MKLHFASLFMFAFCGNVYAVTVDEANQVVAKLESLRRPAANANPFERWTYDTAGLTAATCWDAANPGKSPPESLKRRFVGYGSFTLPSKKQTEKLCQSIVDQGIRPVCTSSKAWLKGAEQKTGSALNLIVPNVHAELKLEGMLTCYLNAGQVQAQQYYSDTLSAQWTVEPYRQPLNTSQGSKTVNMGNVMITDTYATGLDGKLYSEPKIAIVE